VLIGAFGLAACVTLIWLGMRAVMDIGGACAEGGPYVPARSCAAGATAALWLGILGLFAFGALGIYAGARIGGGWAALPLLGWPALFGSLGWNFLEYGFTYEDGVVVWGWVIPGVIFVAMAVVPLWFTWMGRSSATPVSARFGLPDRMERGAPPTQPAASASADHRPDPMRTADDAVDRLERLAELHRRGDLTTAEYEGFKTALLRDMENQP
jgi:hypothetical protein